MASVGIYLNFDGDTEAAFEFYREVFGGELTDFMRMGDMPAIPGALSFPRPSAAWSCTSSSPSPAACS